jgi:RHS repeat-associated protein
VDENGYRLSSINGNLTHVKVADQVVWTYTYDAANRMIHAEDGTGLIQADYGYDPFGRRLWKTVDNITTYFQYADEGLIGEFDAGGAAIRTYGYLPGSSTPLFLKQNDTYYWYRTDRLGIPHTLVESNGNVVWSGAYDAFGNCEVDAASTVVSNLRLPGQYVDAETGLYYNLKRYYDPKTGRYLQPDPAGDGLNPYTYVGANPVNAIDPEGLCALRMIGGGADIWAGYGLIGLAISGPAGWGVSIGAGVIGGLTMLNGADNLIAGGRSAITGEYTRSFGEAAIHHYVQNDLAADLLYTGTQLGLGYAGIRADRALRTARLSRLMGTSETNGSFTNLGSNPGAHNSATFDSYPTKSGFSGVYDVETGKWLAYPSGETLLLGGGKPEHLVSQYGGHAVVNAALTEALGKSSLNRLGFSMVIDDVGNFKLGWNSGMINAPNPNFVGRTVPETMRQAILDAIMNVTGRKAY